MSRLLLEKGAHVNAVAKFNDTTLVWASRNGHERIVPLLLEKGAHINAAAEFGDTALVRALRNEHEHIARLLLEKGAEINATGYDGTALVWASREGHVQFVLLLMPRKASTSMLLRDMAAPR